MERKIILTGDGSHSISVPELNVAYHSVHGAIQESMHVFINTGFYGPGRLELSDPYRIFEVGLGTGLNAFLTFLEAEKNDINVYYEAVEPYPLAEDEVKQLNYCRVLNRPDLQMVFEQIHNCDWEKEIPIGERFILSKKKTTLVDFSTLQPFNLIYFDAFAPNAQPELWTREIFDKMYSILVPGGIVVTYCSKGEVRRNMIAAGFNVEKLPGPPKKREMLRAAKKMTTDS